MFIPIRKIYELTEKIKKTYDERDLITLMRMMGIEVDFKPLGNNQTSCKGFYTTFAKFKLVTINSDMTDDDIDMVLPHEFGHAAQNHKADRQPLQDFILLNNANKMEICANYFSADWKMKDIDIIEHIKNDTNYFAIARMMRVLPDLLAYKYHSMQVRGHKHILCPIDIRAQYLKEYKRPLKIAEGCDSCNDWD